jgi:hypothetical protein
MLGVALGAILLACLLMLMILWRYDFKVNSKLAARDSGVQNLTITAAIRSHCDFVSPGLTAGGGLKRSASDLVAINPPSVRLGPISPG